MVREVSRERHLPGTVQEVFQAIYADRSTTEQFHHEVTEAIAVSVTDWTENTRTVKYELALQLLPSAAKRLLGSSSIPVTEVQTLSFGDNGTMTVASSPTLGITGGSKFTTTTLVTASNAEVNGRPCCHVTAQASCAAAGPYGMISMIEGIMAEQASLAIEKSLGWYLNKCNSIFGQLSARADQGPAFQPASYEQDTFYDASDRLSRAVSMPGSANELQLQHIAERLDGMHRRLQGLTEDVASTKSAVLAAIGPPIKMTGAAMPWNWQSQAFWALTGAAVGVMGCYAALSLRSRQLT